MSIAERPRMDRHESGRSFEQRSFLQTLPALTPVDLIAEELREPGKFTKTEQVFVLKAHGLSGKEVGIALKRATSTVRNFISEEGKIGVKSSVDLIYDLKSERLTPLIIKGLNFDLYGGLADREREILDMAAKQMKNKDIAQRFGSSEKVVKDQFLKMYQKLGVRNRTQAIVYRLFIPNEKVVQASLSPREKEILEFLKKGHILRKYIASKLGLGESTVDTTIGILYRKFNVSNGAELMRVFADQKSKKIGTQA